MSVAMSVEPAAPRGYGRPFVKADLDAMPDDGRRYEIIDVMLIVSAASGHVHQRAVGELFVLLREACPATALVR